MTIKPFVAYCLFSDFPCPLVEAMRSTFECLGDGARLAARILRVNRGGEYSEVWFRVSGSKEAVEEFMRRLRRMPGVYTQIVYSSSFNKVARSLLASSYCEPCMHKWNGMGSGCCPLMEAPIGAMVKTAVVTNRGLVLEYIVAKRQALEQIQRMGCKILHIHSIDEYSYSLTEKQEEMVLFAYLMGYYSFPRKISLRELAEKLGISVSTLAEHLRRAEAKIVEAFIRHELPHYLLEALSNPRKLPPLRSKVESIGKKPS